MQVNGQADVYAWIQSIIIPAWNDPNCGDISCDDPFEFPQFGASSPLCHASLLPAPAMPPRAAAGPSPGLNPAPWGPPSAPAQAPRAASPTVASSPR